MTTFRGSVKQIIQFEHSTVSFVDIKGYPEHIIE